MMTSVPSTSRASRPSPPDGTLPRGVESPHPCEAAAATRLLVALLVLVGCVRRETNGPGAAPRTYEVKCGEEHTRRSVSAHDSGYASSYFASGMTFWTATVAGLRVDPRHVPRITAFTCGRERIGPSDVCPRDGVCTLDGGVPEPDCTPTEPMLTSDGRVVVSCGWRMMSEMRTHFAHDSGMPEPSEAAPGPTVVGERYRRAYVRVE